jgi:hypothetical protein
VPAQHTAGAKRYVETRRGAPTNSSPHVTPTRSTASKTISRGGLADERGEAGKIVFTRDNAETET